MDHHAVKCAECVFPSPETLQSARSRIVRALPETGIGYDKIQKHLRQDLVPAFNNESQSANYYGFVTGGTTPAAVLGDSIVLEKDQNLHSHLPQETVATEVEDVALDMLCELLLLQPKQWPHRTFTTGATASNVLGLACGRQWVLKTAAEDANVAELGLSEAMRVAGIERVDILTTVPHSSLRKAASIIGLGRARVQDVGLSTSPHRFDLEALETMLSRPRVANIVAVSCGEVNTGLFATNGDDMLRIRKLCDKYHAWLHVDAAFGLLARTLPPTTQYGTLLDGVAGLELADSITGDAHKLLNVPYDCGIFLSRHLDNGIDVFQNTNAAYLTAATASNGMDSRPITSPLNLGIENSRRFRALPVYSTLTAYGRQGYQDMMERQIRLARGIAAFLRAHEAFELLPTGMMDEQVYIIVLFRAKDEAVNTQLVRRINETRRIYVSGTVWDSQPAARFAVATWMVDVGRDLAIIKEVLTQVLAP